jgi:hypothetical protein
VSWLAGSFTRPVTVRVDGHEVGRLENDIKYAGLAQAVATIHLDAGEHTVEVVRGGGTLAPGNGAGGTVGPFALTPASPRPEGVRYVTPDDYRSVCGRSVDWIEVVRGVPNSAR